MAKSGISRAQANKSIREEALREQLRAKGLVQHVIEISEKLQDLGQVLEPNDVVRLKASADLKLKLVAKYLPDLKAIEHSVDPENPLTPVLNVTINSDKS